VHIERIGPPKVEKHPTLSGRVELWYSLTDEPDEEWKVYLEESRRSQPLTALIGVRIHHTALVVEAIRQKDESTYAGYLTDQIDLWLKSANKRRFGS
jgi:hypothetical protein